MSNKTSQVIILGNDFDKACGLNISCEDYIEWKFKRLFQKDYNPKEYKNIIQEYINKRNLLDIRRLNFWELILFEYNVKLGHMSWEKFNEVIKKVLNYIFYPTKNESTLNDYVKRLIKVYNGRIISKFYQNNNTEFRESTQKKYFIIDYSDSWIYKYYRVYYLEQLNFLERNVNSFCKKKKDLNIKEYRRKVNKNLKQLLQIDTAGHSPYKNHYILSLNSLIKKNDICLNQKLSLEYLNSFKIKLGISKINTDKEIIAFSKWYSFVMDNSLKSLDHIPSHIDTIDFVGNVYTSSNFDYIDYLFNKCNLISTDLRLSFNYSQKYYSKHEVSVSISRLIYHYEYSYMKANIDLFYKLLVEGKIDIAKNWGLE